MTAQELAEKNHNLIFGFAVKKGINLNANEDYYGILAEAFWKACLSYDEKTKIAFSSYAFKCMNNAYANQVRYSQYNCHKVTTDTKISLDKNYNENEYEDGNDLYNMVGDEDFSQEIIEKLDNQETIRKIWHVASKVQREYMELFYTGLRDCEVARKLGITTACLLERKKDLRRHLNQLGIVCEL